MPSTGIHGTALFERARGPDAGNIGRGQGVLAERRHVRRLAGRINDWELGSRNETGEHDKPIAERRKIADDFELDDVEARVEVLEIEFADPRGGIRCDGKGLVRYANELNQYRAPPKYGTPWVFNASNVMEFTRR